jgi:hypothetical protein
VSSAHAADEFFLPFFKLQWLPIIPDSRDWRENKFEIIWKMGYII